MSNQLLQANSFNIERFSKENGHIGLDANRAKKAKETKAIKSTKHTRNQDPSENQSNTNEKFYNTEQLAHFFQNLMALK